LNFILSPSPSASEFTALLAALAAALVTALGIAELIAGVSVPVGVKDSNLLESAMVFVADVTRPLSTHQFSLQSAETNS